MKDVISKATIEEMLEAITLSSNEPDIPEDPKEEAKSLARILKAQLACQIHYLMRESHLTVADLAEKTGMQESRISKILDEKISPGFLDIAKFIVALDGRISLVIEKRLKEKDQTEEVIDLGNSGAVPVVK